MCNSSHGLDINASNYVAKSYIEVVDRDVYFQDVKLQMDAKLWGEEYNRHNPPKKVSPTSAIRSTCAVHVCDSFFFFQYLPVLLDHLTPPIRFMESVRC